MSNLFDLTGRVALVTGASSGLGVQFAMALARQGADVAIVARRLDRLEEVKKDIEALGRKALAVRCDVTDSQNITDAVAEVKEHFGRIDILVNNAGVAAFEPAATQTDDSWEWVMDVNINGVYYFAREVGKVMIEQKYGRIINIGSIHSTVAMYEFPLNSYATTKGAVEMMTKGLAVEWAKHGITVNAVGPAYFPSEMTEEAMAGDEFANIVKTRCPMGRAGRDGELDTAIVYFASEASSYTTGQLLTVDGGWTAI